MQPIESLEARMLLSGNIKAWVAAGTLHVIGDAEDNKIILTADPSQPTRFSLAADGDDTTINGEAGPAWFSGIFRDVRIVLGHGNNSLKITEAALPRNLTVMSKHGQDMILLEQTQISGSLTINTGGGDDTVDLNRTDVGNRTRINTGAGADIFTAEGSSFRRRFLLNVGPGESVVDTEGSNFFGGKIITSPFGRHRAHARVVNKHFDFRKGDFGWKAGYSDYGPEQEELLDAAWGLRQLPRELRPRGTGYYLRGKNVSDDLFMFIYKRLGPEDGLRPNQSYQVRYTIRFASNAPSGAVGVGGAPGESVWLKAGASRNKPQTSNVRGRIELNIDHGEQSQGGSAVSLIGNIANGREELDTPYVSLVRKHIHPYVIQANENGEMYLIVGIESGFESTTALYFQDIDVQLVPVNLPSQEKVPSPGDKDGAEEPDVKPV